MTRIRTGIARRPDGPEDANPMNRRLPAEVVSRRKGENRAHPGKAAKEEVAPSHLSTDLKQVLGYLSASTNHLHFETSKTVLAMKPEARSKWLSKAVQQAHPQDGRLSPKSIYEIIAHTKFVKDISEKLGQRMYRVLHANLSLFSTKQQKFLEKECALAKQFATAAFAPAPGAEEEEEVTTAADAMEDMMERQSERGERNVEGEADAEDAVPQTQEAKQATQDEAAELREANEEMKVPEQPLSQAEPQKEEVDGHLTRASKSRSRSDDRRSIAQEAKTDPGEKVDVKVAPEEASKHKKASNPERKENGRAKETKDLKDSKASEKTKKPKDEGSKEAKSKPLKSTKEKAKEGRKRESHKRRSSSSQTSRRTREDSESSRGRRRSDKRRGKRSRNSSDSSSFDSRRRGRSSSSRPKRRR